MCTSAWRTWETVSTSGTARTSSAAEVLNPANVGDVRMKSARSVRSRIAVVEAFADAPNTATNTTSPRPIISADAVEAVRRGFRIAFSRRACRGPRSRVMGAPIAAATGRAISGVSIATPTNVKATPSPTSWSAFDGLPNSPYNSGDRRRARGRSRRRSAGSRSERSGAVLRLPERLDRSDARGSARRDDGGDRR